MLSTLAPSLTDYTNRARAMATPIVPERRCSRCKQMFPLTLDYFYRDSSNKSGLGYYCRNCSAIHSKSPEGRRAQHKYAASSKGKSRREERKKSGERKKTVDKYNASDKRKVTLARYQSTVSFKHTQRKYRLSPKGQAGELRRNKSLATKVIKQRYRAKKRGLPATLTAEDKLRAIEYFGGCCPVCGRPFKDLFGTHTVSFDHWWIPLSRNGGYTSDNVIPLCFGVDGCNNSKNDSDPVDWLNRRYGKRKAKQILKRIEAYFLSVRRLESERI